MASRGPRTARHPTTSSRSSAPPGQAPRPATRPATSRPSGTWSWPRRSAPATAGARTPAATSAGARAAPAGSSPTAGCSPRMCSRPSAPSGRRPPAHAPARPPPTTAPQPTTQRRMAMPDILDELSLDSWGGGEEEEEEEGYFDEEYIPESWTDEDYDEASDSERRRRRAAARARKLRRQRQLRAARQRRQRPARPVRTAKAAITKTRDDLKEVALENEVKSDAIGGALKSLARRTGGLENGAVATPAIRLAQARIGDFLPGLDPGAQAVVSGLFEVLPIAFPKAGRKQLIGLAAGAAVLVSAEIAKRLQ